MTTDMGDASHARHILPTMAIPMRYVTYPEDTRRNDNVIMTSKRRRFDVLMTLLLRRVFVGPCTTHTRSPTRALRSVSISDKLCGEDSNPRQRQGSKLRGAEGQNAPKLSPNAPRLLNLGAKFCYLIQPDICFEA